MACLKDLQACADNPSLMTPELMTTLCDHVAGHYRVLTSLASVAQRELIRLDEKLYLDVFRAPAQSARQTA